jgi:hypothetical protein
MEAVLLILLLIEESVLLWLCWAVVWELMLLLMLVLDCKGIGIGGIAVAVAWELVGIGFCFIIFDIGIVAFDIIAAVSFGITFIVEFVLMCVC